MAAAPLSAPVAHPNGRLLAVLFGSELALRNRTHQDSALMCLYPPLQRWYAAREICNSTVFSMLCSIHAQVIGSEDGSGSERQLNV